MAQDYFYFLVYKCPKCCQQQTCNVCSNNPQLPSTIIKEVFERVGVYCKTLNCEGRCGAAELQAVRKNLNAWLC
jgi:hypothetical protein